jgi:hypothetical protein
MSSIYKEKVIKALASCISLEEIQQVQDAVQITDQINRRTKAGRELTEELVFMCYDKREELAKTINPF